MKSVLVIATMLTTAMFTSSPAQAAPYHDRAAEGLIAGALLGTIAEVIITDQRRPAPVAYYQPRPHRIDRLYKHGYRHGYREQRAPHYRDNRYVAREYGQHHDRSRWSNYRSEKRHGYRERAEHRDDRHKRSERKYKRGHD